VPIATSFRSMRTPLHMDEWKQAVERTVVGGFCPTTTQNELNLMP
jgi:hypothetical protein